MIYGLLLTVYIIIGILLILIILLQKGKGSLGLGSLSGGSQILFGGSGGQDLFQKITWGLGILFMSGSLVLALMKNKNYSQSRYLTPPTQTQVPQIPTQQSVKPQDSSTIQSEVKQDLNSPITSSPKEEVNKPKTSSSEINSNAATQKKIVKEVPNTKKISSEPQVKKISPPINPQTINSDLLTPSSFGEK